VLILIPVKGTDPAKARITTRMNAEKWALVDFGEGEIKSVDFYDDRSAGGAGWIDFVVLENSFENYMDFMEEGTMVLVRRPGQDTIELIIEAFKFKELDETGF
jgi:predicted Fe-Mo cluster-binding NifX family protein